MTMQTLAPYCRIVTRCPAGYVPFTVLSVDSAYRLMYVEPLPALTASVPAVPGAGPVTGALVTDGTEGTLVTVGMLGTLVAVGYVGGV